MLVLSIDCANSACSVCVWQDERILAETHQAMLRGQDARLMPMVIDTLAQAGVGFENLDRIAVTRGPGSFTGVRVGLAAARGIGLAAHKPVIGIDRFAIYHAACPTPAPDHLIVIESKRAEVFCQFFPANAAAQPPVLMDTAQIESFRAAHPDIRMTDDRTAKDINVTALCARLAAQADPDDPAFRPSPLYLRAPDVSFPKAASSR